jgi:WD40 repeat protein
MEDAENAEAPPAAVPEAPASPPAADAAPAEAPPAEEAGDDDEDKLVERRKAGDGEGDATTAPAGDKPGSAGAGIARASKQFQIAQRFSKSFTSIRSRRSIDSQAVGGTTETGIPVGFYYNAKDMEAPPQPPNISGAMPDSFMQQERVYGFDFNKKYNVIILPNSEMLYASGMNVYLYNYITHEYKTFPSLDRGGIGCFGVDPNYRYLAIGESCLTRKPNVHIYEIAKNSLYRVLRNGTDKSYACVAFSPHHPVQIATLGCAPDYLLTIWDWTQERILLKCKAFGQEIFGVKWCVHPGQLLTFGSGHIRFWKSAKTFTGLKLQGAIGKFGQTDLSDVVGCLDLPDGRVLSGTEYGKLLVWTGVFVTCELVRGGTTLGSMEKDETGKIPRVLPHEGKVEVMMQDHEAEACVSCGDDGWIRWWPMKEIDFAEADYDSGSLEVQISCMKEVCVPPQDMDDPTVSMPADIMHVSRSTNDKVWLLQDRRNGVVWKYDREQNNFEVVVRGHSLSITGAMLFPRFRGLAVTAGSDGTLRGYNTTVDTRQKCEVFRTRYAEGLGITCVSQMPEKADPKQRSFAAGFSDGTVRIMSIIRTGFELQQAMRVHNDEITVLSFSEDGEAFVACSGADIFFFQVQTSEEVGILVPVGFVTLTSKVRQVVWNDDIGRLLACCDNGTLAEFVRPVPEAVNNNDSFHIELEMKYILPDIPDLTVKEEPEQPQGDEDDEEGGIGDDEPKPKEEEKEAEERDLTCSARAAVYLSADTILFVGTGLYAGHIWETSFRAAPMLSSSKANPTPFATETVPRKPICERVSQLTLSPSCTYLLVGFATGQVWVVPLSNLDVHLEMLCGEMQKGSISSVSMTDDEAALVASGEDGSLTVNLLNPEAVRNVADRAALLEAPSELERLAKVAEFSYRAVAEDQWELLGADPDLSVPEVEEGSFSIQDAKLRSEEENARAAAERQKKRVRERVAEHRAELEAAMSRNELLPKRRQLIFVGGSDADKPPTFVDPGYIQTLQQENEDRVVQVQEELNWEIEYHTKRLTKLEERFLKGLDFEVTTVSAFSKSAWVQTFRTPALSSELQSNLSKLHALIADVGESDSESASGDKEKKKKKEEKKAERQETEKQEHLSSPDHESNR